MDVVPRPGEVYWLDAGGGRGHEQSGRRPVVVITDARLTSLGLAWVVPLTTTDRGWPLHMRVHVGGRLSLAMCEQLRSVSAERLGRFVGTIGLDELVSIRCLVRDIVGQ
jgi:mRNA interferase MazF